MELIRAMITDITVVPRAGAAGVDLELKGDLARILHLCATSELKQNAQAIAGAGRVGTSAYEVSVVAGIGNHSFLPTDLWTTPLVSLPA
jgi:hypothetical protein